MVTWKTFFTRITAINEFDTLSNFDDRFLKQDTGNSSKIIVKEIKKKKKKKEDTESNRFDRKYRYNGY